MPTSAALAPILMSFPGGWEWMIILVLVLIFFGNRIPGLAKSLGGGIHEFKKGLKEGEGNGDDTVSSETKPPSKSDSGSGAGGAP